MFFYHPNASIGHLWKILESKHQILKSKAGRQKTCPIHHPNIEAPKDVLLKRLDLQKKCVKYLLKCTNVLSFKAMKLRELSPDPVFWSFSKTKQKYLTKTAE